MKILATILTLFLLANCNSGTTHVPVTVYDTTRIKIKLYDTTRVHDTITIHDTTTKKWCCKIDTTKKDTTIWHTVDSIRWHTQDSIRWNTIDTFAVIPIAVDKRFTPYLNKRYKGDSTSILIKFTVDFTK